MLTTLRRCLGRGALPPDQAAMLRARLVRHPRGLVPARAQLAHVEQISLFVRNVEKEYGTVAFVADFASVPAAVTEYLAKQNLSSELIVAPHPELLALPWADRALLRWRVGRAEASDVVSLQHAFAAVAETGTLVLPSAAERPTTLNLLVETEIVVLRTSRVVGAYEEAWDLLRAERPGLPDGGFMPRSVMLVTGPSRSADVEQMLELGAHGPHRLHVILVQDGAAAAPAC